jgi:hypothetical protein
MKRLLSLSILVLVTGCSSVQFLPADFADLGTCEVQGCKNMSIHEHVVFP